MKLSRLLCAVAALAVCSPAAWSQGERAPVRMLAGYPPGGDIDLLARVLGERLAEAIGRPVVVVNRPGAGGQIAAETLKSSAPDGSTLLLSPDSVIIYRPQMMAKPPYDAFRDFVAVAHAGSFGYALAVHAQAPPKDVAQLIEWVKANPDAAHYGSTGPGGTPHLYGLEVGPTLGVPLRHVPYAGAGPAVAALAAGHLSVAILPIGTVVQQAKAGRIRLLAASTGRRTPALPEVPTFTELGHAGLEVTSWQAIFAPGGTPPALVARYNDILIRAQRTPAIAELMRGKEYEIRELSPAQLADILRADYARWGRVIKASGLSLDQ